MTPWLLYVKHCMFTEPAPPHIDQSESSMKKTRANTESQLSSSQNEIDLLTGDDEIITGSTQAVPPPVSSRPRPVPPKSLGPGIGGQNDDHWVQGDHNTNVILHSCMLLMHAFPFGIL